MRYLVCCVAILTGLLTTAVSAEETAQSVAEIETCVEAGSVQVPDGNKASSEEMLRAQKDVNNAVVTSKVYLACLLANEKVIGDALTFEEKKASITRYNLAVARLERLVETYNQQLRVYQQASRE